MNLILAQRTANRPVCSEW